MKHVLSGAAMSAALVGAAAAEPADFPREFVQGFYVTLEEVRHNSAQVFEAFAGPEGGPIPREDFVSTELPSGVVPGQPDRQLLDDLFAGLDANGDGELTREEWNERLSMDLEFADQNGDGRITLKELSNARENLGLGDAIGMFF